MEPTTMLLMLFLLLVAAGGVIAWLTIYQRKGGHEIQPPEDDEAQQEVDEKRPPTLATKERLTPEQKGAPIAQETQSTGENAQPTAAQELEQIVLKETQPTEAPETKVATPEEAGSRAGQGAEQIEGEETQPQAVVEELRPIATETKRTVPEVGPATTPEELQPILVEKVQPQVVEKPQPTRPIQESPRGEEGRRKPVHNRGGRPRGPTQPREGRTTRETASRRPKPEIVCWNRARQWYIGIEVPEALYREKDGVEVYQDGSPLSCDDLREGCWRLNSISGKVTVQWNKGDAIEEVNLSSGQDGYLLFKLSGEGLKQGRLVKSASSGSYLVTATDSWEYDEMVAGAPPVMPEPVALDGYRAHFFDLEKNDETRIAFRTIKGDPITIPSNSVRFELVGEELGVINEGGGPLFSEPPKIHALDTQAWKEVKTIVIGEEGGGRGKWRTAFSPDTDDQEEELPYEILNRRGGWYFLRFYDGNYDLVESLDFRFLSGLNQIKIFDSSPLPGTPDGHKRARIEIFHDSEIIIHPKENIPGIQIEREAGKTVIMIPPNPEYNATRWKIGYRGGPQVQVTILAERIWWALGEEETEPSNWIDKPIHLSRDHFFATSGKLVWLRFPQKRWIDNVLVGFERSKARPYAISVTKEKVSIPLRDFTDAQELRSCGIHSIKAWIRSQRKKVYEGTLCELTIKLRCKLCEFDTLHEEDMFSHITLSHLSELFSPLSYEELRAHIPSLPKAIYQCSYCAHYIRSDDLRNPTSTICAHIENDCPNAHREAGLKRISFRIISDPNEIRRNVIRNLPYIYKCKLCGNKLNDPTEQNMIDHLAKRHKNHIYELL